MRDLARNKRSIYYANRIGNESITDEYGNDTLESHVLYSAPIPIAVNVSANSGKSEIEPYGRQAEYSRTITVTGQSCPIEAGAKIWIGISTESPANYTAIRVADSKNGFTVGLREIAGNG